MAAANTLAYYDTETVTAGACTVNLYTAVIVVTA